MRIKIQESELTNNDIFVPLVRFCNHNFFGLTNVSGETNPLKTFAQNFASEFRVIVEGVDSFGGRQAQLPHRRCLIESRLF